MSGRGRTGASAGGAQSVTSVAGRIGGVVLASPDLSDGTAPGRAVFTAASAAAQLAAIGGQAALVAGTNLRTVNGTSLLGSGDLATPGGVSSVAGRAGAVTLASADLTDGTGPGRAVFTAATAAAQLAAIGGVGTAQVGAASGVASLDASGKLPASQVPDLAIVQYLGAVANQAAMLALTGQRGDWCIRSDLGTVFVLNADTPAALGSWTQLSYPAAPVISVAGRAGAVTLASADLTDGTGPGRTVFTAASAAAQLAAIGGAPAAQGALAATALQPPQVTTTTVLYTAAVTANRFVSWAGAHATDPVQVLGVSTASLASGATGTLAIGYSYQVESGAAFAAGASITTDSVGRAIAATGAQCGRAVTAATAAGQLITVVLQLIGGGLSPAAATAAQALVAGAGIVAAGAQWRAMQDALNNGKLTLQKGAYTLSEPILVGARRTLIAEPGVTVTNTGAFQHNMVRVGNADFLGSQDALIGISMFCADELGTYIEGALTYTLAGNTLTWQLDGDTAGTPVSIASVITPATGGLFQITSGSGHSVYVKVVATAARNSTQTKRVRVEPIDGMRSITWSRDTTTLTVTEPGNQRKVGDLVQLWGANLRRHLYIDSLQPASGTWTVADTRGSGSGSGGVFGVNSITLRLAGSLWDQARGIVTVSNTPMCDHTFMLYCCGGLSIEAPTITRNRKYGMFITGCSGVIGSGLRISGDPALSNDGLHIVGPSRLCDWNGVSGNSGDNLTAMGCSDLDGLIWFWPSQGTTDIENWTIRNVRGEGSMFELFRIYNANSGTIRSVVVDGLSGTVSSTTNAVVTVMEDSVTAGMVDNGATNIDGLTVRNVTALRANGSQMPTFNFVGAGIKRNIRLENVIPQVCGAVAGTVFVTTTLEDLSITVRSPAQPFAGAFVSLTSASSRIKRLSIEGPSRIRADNQAPVTLGNGSAATPIIVETTNAAAQIDFLEMRGMGLEDVSSTGNLARVVSNGGIINKAMFSACRTTASDSWWRQNSGASVVCDIAAVNCDFAGNFGITADVGIAAIRETNCRIAGTAHQFAATASFKVDATNCVFDNTFIRGAANSPTITFTATGCTAVAVLATTGGTPVYRLGGACNLVLDGTLLDATVANHAPGSSFYDTNATFSLGVGAYVRGATAWVRVAA